MNKKECPHCHSKEGYYIRYQYSGSGIYRFSFNSTEMENGDMYDNLISIPSKHYYCLNCNKIIGKVEELEDCSNKPFYKNF